MNESIGIKKSQRGAVRVYRGIMNQLHFEDGLSLEAASHNNLLETIFIDGKLTNPVKFSEIRKKLSEQ